MSTKDDVSNFLQLGAKYELILTGLFDEISQQRVVIEEIQLGVRDSKAVLEQTSADFQNATANLTKSLATQKKRLCSANFSEFDWSCIESHDLDSQTVTTFSEVVAKYSTVDAIRARARLAEMTDY